MFQIPKSLGLPLKTRYYTSIPDSFCDNNNNSNYLPRNPCIKLGRKPTAKSQQPASTGKTGEQKKEESSNNPLKNSHPQRPKV